MRPLIIANWKMHGTRSFAAAWGADLPAHSLHASVIVCPPFTLLREAANILTPKGIQIGGQDCHPETKGAFTGDISPEMLKDSGAEYVILGHSERRQRHSETSELVRQKAQAAVGAGLTPILCVGETWEERSAGNTLDVLAKQIRESLPQRGGALILAYEPVWAIGTGNTPQDKDITAAHHHIKQLTAELFPVIYGGSVNAENVADILRIAGVDGVLVGSASLKAEQFSAMILAAEARAIMEA